MRTLWDDERQGARRRARFARGHRVCARPRRTANAHARARRGRGVRARARRPRSGACAARRFGARTGVRRARQRAARRGRSGHACRAFRRHRELRDRGSARVPRSLGRRALRDDRRDGVRERSGGLVVGSTGSRTRSRSFHRGARSRRPGATSGRARALATLGAAQARLTLTSSARSRSTARSSSSTTGESCSERALELRSLWSEPTFRLQSLRDNPSAPAKRASLARRDGSGTRREAAFRFADGAARGARAGTPKVAMVREQGVNGQVEMAAAFTRAGFEAHDVHMSDVLAGRIDFDVLSRARRVRRLLVRRRARRRPGLGEIHSVHDGARRLSGFFARPTRSRSACATAARCCPR